MLMSAFRNDEPYLGKVRWEAYRTEKIAVL
jgi:hypothetical protein